MNKREDAIQTSSNVPEYMSIQQIQQTTTQDEHVQWFQGYIITGWPESKDHIHQDIRAYWSFKGDMAVIDGVIMKGRHIVIPEILKAQALVQLHISHIDIDKTKLLAY